MNERLNFIWQLQKRLLPKPIDPIILELKNANQK